MAPNLGSFELNPILPLFLSTFTTMLAVINPLEVLPVFLSITHDKDDGARRRIAFLASLYALVLVLFFLFFGAFVLKIFGVSLNMVRIAGGIVLTRIGFELFAPAGGGQGAFGSAGPNDNIAFMPLAMPLMVGPGVIATVLGMMATIERAPSEMAAYAAILGAAALAVFITYLCLAYAGRLIALIGRMGIDAITKIVGFFVSAMGVSLVFDGIVGALGTQGVKVVL
ncbi:MarC family protein [Methylocystis sp. JAN1]|uniref:MarC family protein n=1 Tax=Methylocystis sp. JAN1 TaxID=3397211 RepID=UPI003FA2F673